MYSKNPQVIETDLERELILLDPGTGEMFSLNGTGRLVWSMLPAQSVTAVAQDLVGTLEVDLATAERDIRELFERLRAAHLIRTSGEGACR